MQLFSPAKVNLSLHILGKREDGYHRLETLMQAVSLKDTLTFFLSNKDHLTSNVTFLPPQEDNLIFKAKKVFERRFGRSFGLKVHLHKIIPEKAGLGGGSSNAATTLFALNRFFSTPFSEEELSEMGAEIGSDISFFFSLGRAFCEGRGEMITPRKEKLEEDFWIIKPFFGLSTPEVFKGYQKKQNPTKSTFFSNDLEESALNLEPRLAILKENLLKNGFSSVRMTGSGSALLAFGKGSLQGIKEVLSFRVKPLIRRVSQWYR